MFAIQVQIGADRRNTLFAYCIQYREDTELDLLPYIVGGVVGAGALLAIIIIALYCVRRWRNTHARRPSNLYSQQHLDDDTQAQTSYRADVGLPRRNDAHQLPIIPGVVMRAQSVHADDNEPAPTSKSGRSLVSRQNTQSIYPTDDDDYSQTVL